MARYDVNRKVRFDNPIRQMHHHGNSVADRLDKLVVIAGGSKGLGKALALELAAKGEQRCLFLRFWDAS